MWQALDWPWSDRVSGSWWKGLIVIGLYFLVQYIAGTYLASYAVQELDLTTQTEIDSYGAAALIYYHPWALTITEVSSLLGLIIGFRMFKFRLINWKHFTPKLIAQSLGLAVVMNIVITGYTLIVNQYFGDLNSTQNQELLVQYFTETPTLNLVFGMAILAPITEELFFRGLVMKYIFPLVPWLGALVSAVVFAWMHNPGNVWEFSIYFLMASFMVGVYWKTRRLEYAILIHIFNNLFAVWATFG